MFSAAQMYNTHEACTGNPACLQKAPNETWKMKPKLILDHRDDPSEGKPGVSTKLSQAFR